MKRQHTENVNNSTLSLWTYAQALDVVPYLRSVMQSFREQWLTLQAARLRKRRFDSRRGVPDRSAFIEAKEVEADVQRAQERLEETCRELSDLNICCLDPARGIAQIPIRVGEDLGWLIFDLFGPNPLDAWRLHSDPLETRRPLISNMSESFRLIYRQA
jgi:hypothetical protein